MDALNVRLMVDALRKEADHCDVEWGDAAEEAAGEWYRRAATMLELLYADLTAVRSALQKLGDELRALPRLETPSQLYPLAGEGSGWVHWSDIAALLGGGGARQEEEVKE